MYIYMCLHTGKDKEIHGDQETEKEQDTWRKR